MPKRSQHLPAEYTTYQQRLAREIGARIRSRRQQLRVTQEQVRARMELAHVHISRTQYSRIEQGKSVPGALEIIALTQALDTSCTWLLFGDERAS